MESPGMSRTSVITVPVPPPWTWVGIACADPTTEPVVATTTASTAIFSRSPCASMSGSRIARASASASNPTRMVSDELSSIRSRSAIVQSTIRA